MGAVGPDAVNVHRHLGYLLQQHSRDGRCLERDVSREHLVGHDPQGVDVAPGVDLLLPRGLLRAHVGRGPNGHACPGEGPPAGVRERLGDPEVRHHHAAAGAFEQDVVGLDVPVDHAHRVGESQRVCRLLHDPAGLFGREALAAPQAGGERLSVDIAHHEVDQSLVLAHGVDRHDVGVGEARGGLRLPQEALADFFAVG